MALVVPIFPKTPVILDVGTSLVKCGFGGEDLPRKVVRTSDLVEDFPERPFDDARPLSRERWADILAELVRRVSLEILNVNYTERNFLICDNPFWPTQFRHALIDACLVELKVQGLRLEPCYSLPLYCTMGQSSALIVDVGSSQTRIYPVCSSHVSREGVRSCNLGLRNALDFVRSKLAPESPDQEISSSTTEDILVRSCVFQPLSRNGDSKASEELDLEDFSYKDFPHTSSPVTVSGVVRTSISRALFDESHCEETLAEFFCDALLRCNADVRAAVCSNVVLCGGTTMVEGFRRTFTREVGFQLRTNPEFSSIRGLEKKLAFAKLPFASNCVFWSGASVLSQIKLPGDFFVTRYDLRDDESASGVHSHVRAKLAWGTEWFEASNNRRI